MNNFFYHCAIDYSSFIDLKYFWCVFFLLETLEVFSSTFCLYLLFVFNQCDLMGLGIFRKLTNVETFSYSNTTKYSPRTSN